MDFSNLLQVFPNKTKVHPVNMFAVIIYAYSQGKYLQGILNFFGKIVKESNSYWIRLILLIIQLFLEKVQSYAERLNKYTNYLKF